jgi:hypothetical protein
MNSKLHGPMSRISELAGRPFRYKEQREQVEKTGIDKSENYTQAE